MEKSVPVEAITNNLVDVQNVAPTGQKSCRTCGKTYLMNKRLCECGESLPKADDARKKKKELERCALSSIENLPQKMIWHDQTPVSMRYTPP